MRLLGGARWFERAVEELDEGLPVVLGSLGVVHCGVRRDRAVARAWV